MGGKLTRGNPTTFKEKMSRTRFLSIDDYHATCSDSAKLLLAILRKAIQEAAPKAVELISYNMPAFKQKKVLVYYAAYSHHIGFYPTSKPIEAFKEELAGYKTSKGAIQFPLDKKLPLGLIKKIVRYRVQEAG